MNDLLSQEQQKLLLEAERNSIKEVFCLLQNCHREALEKQVNNQIRVNVSDITKACIDMYNKMHCELLTKDVNKQNKNNYSEVLHSNSHRITNELDTINKGVKNKGFYIITKDYRPEEKNTANNITDNLSDIKKILCILAKEIREKAGNHVRNSGSFKYKLIA